MRKFLMILSMATLVSCSGAASTEETESVDSTAISSVDTTEACCPEIVDTTIEADSVSVVD